MSFSHWWFSCVLTSADEQRFESLFGEAEGKARLSSGDEEALRYWEAHPERFSSNWIGAATLEERRQHGELFNRFVWAFNLPDYGELAKQATGLLSEDNCFRFVTIRRCSPGAVLWHAIGRERATLLPGNRGNVFLRSQEVADALSATESVMKGLGLMESGTPVDWIRERYSRIIELYCGCSVEEAAERFKNRKRHPGHLDRLRTKNEIIEWLTECERYLPLSIGTLETIDARSGKTADDLIARISDGMRSDAQAEDALGCGTSRSL